MENGNELNIPVKLGGLHLRAVISGEDRVIYENSLPSKNSPARVVKVMGTNPGTKQSIVIAWIHRGKMLDIKGKLYTETPVPTKKEANKAS